MEKFFDALQQQFFEAIQDARQWLRLFDFLPGVYLYVKDAEGRFVGFNQPWLEMRGIDSANELIGKTDADLHPLYWARQYQEEDRRVMNSGKELPNQYWLVPRGNGKLSTFVSSKIPIRSGDGKVIGIAGVMYDLEPDRGDDLPRDPTDEATEMIVQKFRDPIQVQQIADAVGLSASQMGRRFRERFRVSPSEYLQRVRINEASRLLADTDRLVADIALDCGFYDQAHLTRSFKKQTGLTPRDFRRAAR